MGKLLGRSVCIALLLVCGVAVLVWALVVGVIRGFRSQVVWELIALSELFLLFSACVFCKLLFDNRGIKVGEYHVVAPLIDCDVVTIPLADRISFDNCASVVTTSGQRISVSTSGYVMYSGALTRGTSLPRNHVAFAVHFPAPIDREYFELLRKRRLSRSAHVSKKEKIKALRQSVRIVPGDKEINVTVLDDFRDCAAEYLIYSMALSYNLDSGEGIKFFKWYCCCCVGMACIPVPFYHDALESIDSSSLFNSFSGAWLAARNYASVFRYIVDYSREMGKKSARERGSSCLSEKEAAFLEKLCDGVSHYSVDEKEYVYAERSLTHMLITMHVVLSPSTCEVFSQEKLLEWLHTIMTRDFGSKECAIHVAMSSFGFARFDGKLIRRTYTNLCSQQRSTFGRMRDHMTDFLSVSSDHVTNEVLSDVIDRKGLEFFAVSAALIPYFYKTKAHKLLLKRESYRDTVADVMFRIKNFDSMSNPMPSEGTVLGMLCYHEGLAPFLGNYDWDLEGYISDSRARVRQMLEQFASLESTCGSNMWRDPSVLKFFVKFAVWIWDSKELSLTRKIKPMVGSVCSVWNVLKRYFHQYWAHLGVDVLAPVGECRTPVDSMFEDKVKVEFCMLPYKESLIVGRNGLFEVMGAFSEKEEHHKVASCAN